MKVYVYFALLFTGMVASIVWFATSQGQCQFPQSPPAPVEKSPQLLQLVKMTTSEVIEDIGNLSYVLEVMIYNPYDGAISFSETDYWNATLTENRIMLRLIEEGKADKTVADRLAKNLDGYLAKYPAAARNLTKYINESEKEKQTISYRERDQYYETHQKYSDPWREYHRLHTSIYGCFYVLANLGALNNRGQLLAWINMEKPTNCDCRKLDAWLIHQFYACAKDATSPEAQAHANITQGLEFLDKKATRPNWRTATKPKMEVLELARESEMNDLIASQIIESFIKASARQ